MSSENWVPFEYVPPEGLVAYLRQKRLEGFTILGLEQVCLGDRGTSVLV